jgi:transposase-like protein
MALTEATKNKIPGLLEKGFTLGEIGKKFKVSPQTISYWDKKLSNSNGSLPTKPQPVARKAKAVIPTAYECPHCGGALLR